MYENNGYIKISFATYDFPGGGLVLGLAVFVLGLVGAQTMLRENGLIGPVLFHAGYDLQNGSKGRVWQCVS